MSININGNPIAQISTADLENMLGLDLPKKRKQKIRNEIQRRQPSKPKQAKKVFKISLGDLIRSRT